jgi:hypothetical protein
MPEEIPYFVDAINAEIRICKHLLKNENRKEIHFISCKGKMRFAFCIDCFTSLMKRAGYREDEVDKFVSKIAVPFKVGE